MSGTGTRGAEFGKILPIGNDALLRVGGADPFKRISLGTNTDTLENGLIQQVSPEGAFEPGQQALFFLTVYNGPVGEGAPYISRVRLKPWWKRITLEKRGPGDPGNNPITQPNNGWIDPDERQFGSGPVAAPVRSSVHADNNRLVWFPVPKLVDVTEWQTVNPPPAAPPRQSDSIFLDDVWTLDLQNPAVAAYAATKGTTQPNFGRSSVFLYITHGYALGLTHQFDVIGQGQPPELFIDLTWATGTL